MPKISAFNAFLVNSITFFHSVLLNKAIGPCHNNLSKAGNCMNNVVITYGSPACTSADYCLCHVHTLCFVIQMPKGITVYRYN